MTQAAPTLCIHVPTLDANWASQSARYVLFRNGAHADVVERGLMEDGVSVREPP
jgi:hypothetical protein